LSLAPTLYSSHLLTPPPDLPSFPTRRSSDLGIPLGILAALRRNRRLDYLISSFGLSVVAIPSFFLGLSAIYIFSVKLADRPRKKDRKSTRLNSSHEWISYAVFCLKKKKIKLISTRDLVSRLEQQKVAV